MKASMMTEAAPIPGIAFFNKLNPKSKFLQICSLHVPGLTGQ